MHAPASGFLLYAGGMRITKEEWAAYQALCTNPVITEGKCYPVGPGPYNCGAHLTPWDLEETRALETEVLVATEGHQG